MLFRRCLRARGPDLLQPGLALPAGLRVRLPVLAALHPSPSHLAADGLRPARLGPRHGRAQWLVAGGAARAGDHQEVLRDGGGHREGEGGTRETTSIGGSRTNWSANFISPFQFHWRMISLPAQWRQPAKCRRSSFSFPVASVFTFLQNGNTRMIVNVSTARENGGDGFKICLFEEGTHNLL